MPVEKTDDGGIIFLARAPGQVADNSTKSTGASVIRGAASGNKNFDPGSGRFASGSGGTSPTPEIAVNPIVVNRSGLPQGVDPNLWEKRLDAVRDAAREYDSMDAGDVTDFLVGRVSDLSQVNVDQFLADVRAQRIDDLVDILDTKVRSQTVKVKARQSWINRVFNGLTDSEAQRVVARLLDRGWNTDQIKKHVVSKVKDESRREALESSIA